jgi:hypothetical protein
LDDDSRIDYAAFNFDRIRELFNAILHVDQRPLTVPARDYGSCPKQL